VASPDVIEQFVHFKFSRAKGLKSVSARQQGEKIFAAWLTIIGAAAWSKMFALFTW
jgi:hypothetical protein